MFVRQKWRIMRNSATQNVVNLAFASTKGLRSNTRAQGYEDVENEELSAKRFFASGIFGTTIWLSCRLLFRIYKIQFRKLSTLRIWGEGIQMHGPTVFYRDNCGIVALKQLIHYLGTKQLRRCD